MSESAGRRFGRLPARKPKLPTEREWERSALLEPRPAPRVPELISDGGGLPFPPAALAPPLEPLDPEDPAVAALSAQLAARQAPKASLPIRRKGKEDDAAAPDPPSLVGWRLLAHTDDEALFARGRPPQLLTVAVQRDPRRDVWAVVGSSAARPLRAAREGIRASGWRLDPTQELGPEDTILRVLITEQTLAGGKPADDRLLAPDLHLSADELVLTIYITPLPGFKPRTRNPETPARIVLPDAVGARKLVDGARYDPAPPGGD